MIPPQWLSSWKLSQPPEMGVIVRGSSHIASRTKRPDAKSKDPLAPCPHNIIDSTEVLRRGDLVRCQPTVALELPPQSIMKFNNKGSPTVFSHATKKASRLPKCAHPSEDSSPSDGESPSKNKEYQRRSPFYSAPANESECCAPMETKEKAIIARAFNMKQPSLHPHFPMLPLRTLEQRYTEINTLTSRRYS